MLRRSISAVAVALILGGFVLAETVRGIIIEAGESTLKVRVFGKDKKSETKDIKVNDKTTYQKRGKEKDSFEKSSLSNIKEGIEKAKDTRFKGVFATIEVEDGTATKVTTGFGGKRPGKKGDKKKEEKKDI